MPAGGFPLPMPRKAAAAPPDFIAPELAQLVDRAPAAEVVPEHPVSAKPRSA
jgi:hypothetical protein